MIYTQVKMLPIKDIKIPLYSLSVNNKLVNFIIKNFDNNLFGTLAVCERDNEYYVIDGQYRLEAANRLGFYDVPCLITKVRNIDEETELFAKENTARTRCSNDYLLKIKSVLQKNNMQFS